MIKVLVNCDCCGQPVHKNDVCPIYEKYKTDKIKVICPTCTDTITKYMERLRTDSGVTNTKRVVRFIQFLSDKSKLVHTPDKQDPIEQLTLKIYFTVIFYTLFSFIALIGISGSYIMFTGALPAISILVMLTAWGLLTRKVFIGIKQDLTTFVLDTEQTYETFLREDMHNRSEKGMYYEMKGFVMNNNDSSSLKQDPWN
jgi:hypothetical protein